jgi:hypothetical protein
MLAAVKFFLGQDDLADGDDSDEEEDNSNAVAGPSRSDVYNAKHKVWALYMCVYVCFCDDTAMRQKITRMLSGDPPDQMFTMRSARWGALYGAGESGVE